MGMPDIMVPVRRAKPVLALVAVGAMLGGCSGGDFGRTRADFRNDDMRTAKSLFDSPDPIFVADVRLGTVSSTVRQAAMLLRELERVVGMKKDRRAQTNSAGVGPWLCAGWYGGSRKGGQSRTAC